MIDVKNVGLFIAECRKSKNWTQKQLGEKLGVTDRAVSKWETGRSLPDISLIEHLCELFDLQVSELLAGKKMGEEEYKKETEQMLIKSIGENQLFGFQIVLHLLDTCALLALYVPLIAVRDSFLPRMTLENVFCWMIAIFVTGSTIYLDRKLPARKYRSTTVWIETLSGVGTFLIMACILLYRDGVTGMKKDDISLLFMFVIVCAVFVGIASFFSVRRRKE